MIPLINVGYASTNYYLLGQGRGRLLVDVGMPGTLPTLLAQLRRAGAALDEVGYLLATHYHPDHAGIAQDLQARGVRLVALEQQLDAIPLLGALVKPGDGFIPIATRDIVRITAESSRAFLAGIGVAGEVVATPGHSSDSVSLVLDDGRAFTGDLPPPLEGDATLARSWATLRSRGATMVYPGHGPPRPLPQVYEGAP